MFINLVAFYQNISEINLQVLFETESKKQNNIFFSILFNFNFYRSFSLLFALKNTKCGSLRTYSKSPCIILKSFDYNII